MNFCQNACIRDFALGLTNRRTLSASTIIYISLFLLAATLSQTANGETESAKNASKNVERKQGIICYVCNSARDPRCGDPFDPTTIEKVDCSQWYHENATVCRKNVQRAILGSKEDLRVIRTCGHLPHPPRIGDPDDDDDDDNDENVVGPGGDRCYNKAGTFEVKVTYCSCHTDGCNNSPRQAWTSLNIVTQMTLQLATMIVGSYLMLSRSLY